MPRTAVSTTTAPSATRYDDNLAARVFTHRFRHVGNPYAFLNDIGVVPMLEFIYKGNLLIDVAEALNVSYTILTTWVENEGHSEAIDEAQRISAEGYLAEGLRRLREAKSEFELKRAKEMVAHARFMASKKDKTQYGTTEQTGVEKAGVSYVFNIAGNVVAPQLAAPATPAVGAAPLIIEGESTPVRMNILDHLTRSFEDMFGVPEGEPVPAKTKPLAKAAPVKQEELPLVGPFYDAVEPS